MRKLTSLLALILTIAIAGNAQNQAGKVKGSIKDGGQKTIESATIYLLNSKDSSVLKMNVADKSGNYQFENITAGKYLVSVTAVGHEKAYSQVFDLQAGGEVSLPTIQLLEQIKSLGAVTVTSKRPFIEQKIDRTIVNVEASVTNVGNSALEVLEKSPGVSVDKDGNISLKGKEGVVVLIDGRPSYLGGADLANLLRSMHANQLDQIEIMTNPPAKFDAAGNSGVINIKTKKNKQFGYNGSTSLGYSQGRYPKSNESFNFNYRHNKVNLFTNLSHNYNHEFNNLSIQRRFIDKSTKEILSNFDQEARMQNKWNSFNAKLGMDYFAGKNTTLGVVFTGFLSERSFINNNLTLISDPGNTLLSQTRATSASDPRWKNFSTNLNFRQVLDTTGSELTADLDFITYDSRNGQTLINAYFDAAGNPTEKADTLIGALPQEIMIYSGKADFLKPLKNGARFEAGLKSSIVKTDNNANYDSVVNGNIVHDFNRSNYFIYEENINAAYVNLSGPLSKKWNAQLGLRVENTNAKGNQVTTGQKFDRNYTQLFPTAFLQYLLNENNSFVMNYGRRIRRPNYQSLNPFIEFLDRYTYQQGNPNLRPQFSHNIELSHTHRNSITTTLNYTRTTDIIQQVIEQNEDVNETYVKQANIAKQRQYGISVNAATPIAKWWKSNIYVNVYNNKYDGIVNNTQVTVNATTLSLNGSQQFTFAKTWNAEISGFFRTGGVEGVINTKPFGMMSVGFGKQILKGKGSLRLNVRDVLYSQRFRGESKYSNIDAAFQQHRDSRVVNLGFSYRFSKGKVNGVPKRRASSASEEQNRVGTGN